MNIRTKYKLFGIVFLLLIAFFCCFKLFWFDMTFRNVVEKYCKIYGVDARLAYSVMKAESNFNPNAVSPKGAVGLMQIMPSTALSVCAELGMDGFDLTNAEDNIRIGVYYLGYLGARFLREDLVVLAYNAGEGNVRHWLNNPDYSDDGKTLKRIPFSESATYLEKIRFYRTVSKIYGLNR